MSRFVKGQKIRRLKDTSWNGWLGVDANSLFAGQVYEVARVAGAGVTLVGKDPTFDYRENGFEAVDETDPLDPVVVWDGKGRTPMNATHVHSTDGDCIKNRGGVKCASLDPGKVKADALDLISRGFAALAQAVRDGA